MPSLSKKAQQTILFMKEGESYRKKDLFPLINNWYSMDRVLEELKKEELITITSEESFGHVAYIISLSSKGVTLHHKLLRIEEYLSTPSYEMPSNFTDRFKNLSALTHFNVKDDHIALTEHNFDGAGNDRIVYVYTRPNGHNFMRLWCDADGTFSCPHTEYAWTLPAVQEMVQLHSQKRA